MSERIGLIGAGAMGEVWAAHSESKVCEAVSTNLRFPLAGNNGLNPANVSSVASHRITS